MSLRGLVHFNVFRISPHSGCSSLSVVPLVTILSAELVLELRTGPVLLRTGLVLVLRTARLPERVLVLVLPTMPQRLPLLQPAQVPPRLAQGKVKAQEM